VHTLLLLLQRHSCRSHVEQHVGVDLCGL
jgi:hypothetical protein